jgi:hypothetical protein
MDPPLLASAARTIAQWYFGFLILQRAFQIGEREDVRLEGPDVAAHGLAEPEGIDQSPPSHESRGPFMDAQFPARTNLAGLDAVVITLQALVAHVGQSIPLAPFLRVEIIDEIVIGKGRQRQNLVTDRCAAEQRRFGKADLGVQPEDLSVLHQARSIDHALRSQEVQATDLIVIAEHAPGRFRRGVLLDR